MIVVINFQIVFIVIVPCSHVLHVSHRHRLVLVQVVLRLAVARGQWPTDASLSIAVLLVILNCYVRGKELKSWLDHKTSTPP